MDKIIAVPLIISAIMLLKKSESDTFILVFIPSLTLFPVYFEVELIKGTPEVYFWSAALIPIIISWTYKKFNGYIFDKMDIVLFLYILIIFMGQWENSDYKKAQKILFNNLMSVFLPYILTKIYARDRETLIKMIKMFTILTAFIAVFNLIEFRMFTNYFDKILRDLWPSYVMWDTGMVMNRWGFKRAFGPFSHPIVSGYLYAFMTPLSIWCHNQKFYRNRNTGVLIVFLNLTGIITSISRAPMIGFFIGLIIIYYGWSQNKAAIMSFLIIISIILLMFILPSAIKYASVTRATAENIEQRNVAYRKEMWEAYTEVVLEKPYLGWGRFSVPSVKGMKSIDSEYLGVALSSGVIALSLYLFFLGGTLLKLFKTAAESSHNDQWGRLSWCIAAGWISAVFSQATVYSGAQSVQYLFMIGGIAQVTGLMKEKSVETKKDNFLSDSVTSFARTI